MYVCMSVPFRCTFCFLESCDDVELLSCDYLDKCPALKRTCTKINDNFSIKRRQTKP